ncbi:MAG: NifU family protein [Pseudobdellovibrionaceae bacterium]
MTEATNSQEVLIRVQPTPNPSAFKFVLDRSVLNDGKATFSAKEECYGNRLAEDLLDVPGVKQVHFFSNVITLTFEETIDFDRACQESCAVIQTRMAVHDPNFNMQTAKKSNRQNLSPELQKVEEILDRTIRPGLQGDGGDIEVVGLEGKKLFVHYEGACGTCPSATSGTLMAIEGIIRDEFDPEIEVVPV